MKKYIFLFIIIFCICTAAFAQTGRDTRYVAVQSTPLKSSSGFFSSNLGTLSLGDAVTLINDNGKWSQIQYGNHTGWIPSNELSTRRIITSHSTGVSASEVALAGKGFSAEMEIEYRKNGLDYSMVDSMERISVPSQELLRFINEGRLNRGDLIIQQEQSAQDHDFTLIDAYYLGRAVAANIMSRYRPYTRNPEAVQYLNRICQTLVINSNHPPAFIGYRVIILDSQEINAFASPGGHIFVTKKLVELAVSEDMLAAVIAHELAHVMLRHSIAIINETRFMSEMSAIAGWAANTAASFSSAAAKAAEFRNSITHTIDILMTNGYSHTQEYEADLEAIMLLARAGYDPRTLVEMLRVLQQVQGSQNSGFYSTHPNPAMRIANLERLNFPANTSGQYRSTRFGNMRF